MRYQPSCESILGSGLPGQYSAQCQVGGSPQSWLAGTDAYDRNSKGSVAYLALAGEILRQAKEKREAAKTSSMQEK